MGVQEVAYLPQGTTAFTDAGPGLRPGERVCYWVRGPETQAYTCTTPLPPLSVSISSPGEGEVTGPTPRLAWAVEGGSGLSFAFQPVVWDQLTGGGLFLGVTQGTEVSLLPSSRGGPTPLSSTWRTPWTTRKIPGPTAWPPIGRGAFRGSPFRGPA